MRPIVLTAADGYRHAMIRFVARWEVALVAVSFLLVLYQSGRRTALRTVCCLLAAGLVALFGLRLLQQIQRNLHDPPEWDYLAFSIPARAAVQGKDFYQPSAMHEVTQGRRFSESLSSTSLDVGFLYPPTTMLMLAPLGWVSDRTGEAAWYLANMIALAAAVLLLARTFFADDPLLGLATVALMALGLRSTSSTVGFAQSNFLALLLLVLYWRSRARPLGGLFLALCAVVKPVLMLLLGYTLLRRQWRGAAVALGATAVLGLLAVLAFGTRTCASFLHDYPARRLPLAVYTESVNQSLPAVLLRLMSYDGSQGVALRQPLVLAGCGAFALVSLLAAARLARRNEELALALVLCAALLLYPGTLEHYSVLLLVPLGALWRSRAEFGWGVIWAVIALAMLLIGFRGGIVAWSAFLLVWLVATLPAWAPFMRGRRARGPWKPEHA
jgi:hypothetical protein